LNQSAALVWECCARPVTLDEIVAAVARMPGVTDPKAAADEALRQLAHVGLVVASDAEPAPTPDAHPASRRVALGLMVGGATIAFVAPLVLTMTVGEQRLLAQQAGSPTPTPVPEVPTTTPPPTPTEAPTPTPSVTPAPTVTPTPIG
jgi:hypothetical protein